MADRIDIRTTEETTKGVSRRGFIKGVITSGVAVSSANYLFRASSLLGQHRLEAWESGSLLSTSTASSAGST